EWMGKVRHRCRKGEVVLEPGAVLQDKVVLTANALVDQRALVVAGELECAPIAQAESSQRRREAGEHGKGLRALVRAEFVDAAPDIGARRFQVQVQQLAR